VRRTLEYYANVLFTTKQGMSETVAQWGSRIDNMGLDLMREARTIIEKINPRAVEGGTILVSEFMKGSFVAGLREDKYVVKAKVEEHSSAQLVETGTTRRKRGEVAKIQRKSKVVWTGQTQVIPEV
jgi:hypothetical protein